MRGQQVCGTHGGASPQAKRKAAERIAFAEALSSSPRRHPGEVLLDAVHTADVMAAQVRAEIAADGQPSRKTMKALIEATTRQGALARAALSAEAEDRVARFGERQVSGLRQVFAAFLSEAGLSGDRRARDAMRRVLEAAAVNDVAQMRVAFDRYSQPFTDRDAETALGAVRWLLQAVGMDPRDPWVMSTIATALRGLVSDENPARTFAALTPVEPPLGWWQQLHRRAAMEIARLAPPPPRALPAAEILPAITTGVPDDGWR